MANNRIFELRKAAGLSQTDLAEAIGTTLNTLGKIERGDRRLNQDWIDRIAKALNVEPGALLTASIPPRTPALPLDMKRAPDQMPTRGAHDGDGSIQLRRINLGFAMGDGTNLDDLVEEGTIDFDANLLRMITAAPSHRLVVADGVGDSMQPTIMDSDMILIDTLQTVLNKSDRIWALSLFGAGAVKRLAPAGEGKVEVISDNPIVPNRVVPAEEIRLIGRVVWSSRRH